MFLNRVSIVISDIDFVKILCIYKSGICSDPSFGSCMKSKKILRAADVSMPCLHKLHRTIDLEGRHIYMYTLAIFIHFKIHLFRLYFLYTN